MADVKKKPTSGVMLCHGSSKCHCGCERCQKGSHALCMLQRTVKEAGFR